MTDGIFANMSFDAHYFQNPEDNDEPLVQQNSNDIRGNSAKIGKKAIKRLQVHDLWQKFGRGAQHELGKHIVHWHADKSCRRIGSKELEVNGRIGKEKTWATSQFNRTYQIAYLINESKDSRMN